MIDVFGQILWWSAFLVVPLAPIIAIVLLVSRPWYIRILVAVFACGAAFAFFPMMAWSIVFRDGMKAGMTVSTGWQAWENAFPGMIYSAMWGGACVVGILVTLGFHRPGIRRARPMRAEVAKNDG